MLTYEDIHHQAEYEVDNAGINIGTGEDSSACFKNVKIYFMFMILFCRCWF